MRDDDLHDRLAGLVAQAGLTLPESRDVLTRGDRRRARVPVVAAGLSVVVAGGVVGAAWSTTGTLPASLSVGATASAGMPSAVPSVISVPLPTGSSAPPHAPDGSHPHSSPPSSPSSIQTKIPANLSMVHQGEAGWTTNTNPHAPGAFNPCAGADVTAVGRTDARTLKGPGMPGEESHSPSKVTHQLLLYASDQAAATVFAKLIAGGCGWARSGMDDGNNHLAHLRKSAEYNPKPGVYWLHDATLVRTGNALFIAESDTSGAGMSSALADQEIGNVVKPLCKAKLVCM